MRKQREVLEHEADVALVGWHVVDTLAIEDDVAAIRLVEAGDDAQERRLAGTARPQQRDVAVAAERQVDALQHGGSAEALFDGVQLQQW